DLHLPLQSLRFDFVRNGSSQPVGAAGSAAGRGAAEDPVFERGLTAGLLGLFFEQFVYRHFTPIPSSSRSSDCGVTRASTTPSEIPAGARPHDPMQRAVSTLPFPSGVECPALQQRFSRRSTKPSAPAT